MRNIFVVGGDVGYINWMRGNWVSNMKYADLVVFTGGADVSPESYGAKRHPTCATDLLRDQHEVTMFRQATGMKKHIIGICRGAQLLCCLAGGRLVQHMRHPHVHEITTDDGRTITVTSSHHQRQYPWSAHPWKLLAWSKGLSPFSFIGPEEQIGDPEGKEVEIAYYPAIKALAIQSHPEWVYPPVHEWHKAYIDYCQELLDKHMANSL